MSSHPLPIVEVADLFESVDRFASRSEHHRTKVGCVLISRDHWFGGFNKPTALPGEWIHAEVMAITRSAEYGIPTRMATLAVNWFPCVQCAVVIAAAGIKTLYHDKRKAMARWDDPDYRFQQSHDLLVASGVNLIPVWR